MHFALCTAYFAVLLVLAMYGLHRSHLVLTVLRHRKALRRLKEGVPALPDRSIAGRDDLPHVTIQLPLYNEATVADRLLDHVAAIEWPRSSPRDPGARRLDRRDARARAPAGGEPARSAGSTSSYIHRVDRTGYKAGALDNGLKVAKGDLVAIFDADFLPQPDFLRAVVPHFMADPRVGMVQARWGHLNRAHSMLTRTQALMLDGHHLVENRARAWRPAGSSTSAAPAGCGARKPSRAPAAGSTTR